MKMKFFYALLCAGAMCLASCGSSRTATTADLSGDWNVVAVNGNDVVLTDDAEQPYLSFDTANGQISGMAGCNRRWQTQPRPDGRHTDDVPRYVA